MSHRLLMGRVESANVYEPEQFDTDTLQWDDELTIFCPDGIDEHEGDSDADEVWITAQDENSWVERGAWL